MNVQFTFAVILVASVISLQGDGGNETARKHYGLSFHSKCVDYVKSFTCMTTCKSIGFRVFRLDFRCKCSCHEIKSTTIVPFFKWRTNGTTKTLPSTQSPNLYHVAGTLSPPWSETTTTVQTTTTRAAITCEPPKDGENATNVDDAQNTDNSEATTSTNEPGDDENNPTKVDDGATEAPGDTDAQNPTEPPSPEEGDNPEEANEEGEGDGGGGEEE